VQGQQLEGKASRLDLRPEQQKEWLGYAAKRLRLEAVEDESVLLQFLLLEGGYGTSREMGMYWYS
jgi:hypothetical protein